MLQMQKQQWKTIMKTKNQGNMSSQKDNNSPLTEPKGTEFWDLTDKEFKIAVLKKFSELQENSEGQFNKIRGKIHEQNEIFTKEIEIINQAEILELKSSINEMKNSIESICIRVQQMEDRISELEGKNFEITQNRTK